MTTKGSTKENLVGWLNWGLTERHIARCIRTMNITRSSIAAFPRFGLIEPAIQYAWPSEMHRDAINGPVHRNWWRKHINHQYRSENLSTQTKGQLTIWINQSPRKLTRMYFPVYEVQPEQNWLSKEYLLRWNYCAGLRFCYQAYQNIHFTLQAYEKNLLLLL